MGKPDCCAAASKISAAFAFRSGVSISGDGSDLAFNTNSAARSLRRDQDASAEPTLLADSVLSPDATLAYPNTALQFIFGTDDCNMVVDPEHVALAEGRVIQIALAAVGAWARIDGVDG